VLIRLSADDVVVKVKVATGAVLAKLDKTGTLTRKYQARFIAGTRKAELATNEDSALLRPFTTSRANLRRAMPTSSPAIGSLLSITTLHARLSRLVGKHFRDSGHDQERNRGGALHRLVCAALGYGQYKDNGEFPDVRHQLLEVKLQTSPTIDLGLVLPSSADPLDMLPLGTRSLRHRDVRYAVFQAHTDGATVTLTHLVITTGEAFFSRFPQFRGKVLNRKLQIPLPAGFFDGDAE
jgi:hypothetical protein